MHINIRFAQLHNPLFIAGKNFKERLDPNETKGLHISFDDEGKRLFVEWNGVVGVVPESNISNMIPSKPEDFQYKLKTISSAKPLVRNVEMATARVVKMNAQISDPVRDAVQGIKK